MAHVCSIFFIHSPTVGHLSWFHNLAIVKSVAINMGMHVSLLHIDLYSSDICSGVVYQGYKLGIFLVFWGPSYWFPYIIIWPHKKEFLDCLQLQISIVCFNLSFLNQLKTKIFIKINLSENNCIFFFVIKKYEVWWISCKPKYFLPHEHMTN
jgi:hypothetical protein